VLQLKGLKVPAVGKKVTLLGGMILGEFEGQLGGRAWVARARSYAEAAAGESCRLHPLLYHIGIVSQEVLKWFGWREIAHRRRPVCSRFPPRPPRHRLAWGYFVPPWDRILAGPLPNQGTASGNLRRTKSSIA
jgi:hypothetical protein